MASYSKLWLAGAVGLVLVSACMLLFQLGEKPFWDYDEAIYANVIQDTVSSGDISTLRQAGNPWFEKPPLVFWTSIAADSVFHNPEFSYRLTAALAEVLSIILVLLITYELVGSLPVAILAAAILITTGPFFEAGRELRLDVPAISMVLLSVYSFLLGLRQPAWFMGIGIGLALGFLCKSVIGLLSIPFILIWMILYRDYRVIKSWYAWIGAALMLLILAPWHIYETTQFGGAFWQGYLFHAVLQRFGSDVIGGSVSVMDYVRYFYTYMAPWSYLFTALMVWLLVRIRESRSEQMRSIFVPALTATFLFGMFLLSSTRILTYLLPVDPFIAIALAAAFGYFLPPISQEGSRVILAAVGMTAVFGLAIWITIFYGFHIFSDLAINDLIVREEKAAALAMKPYSQEPVYAYHYDYYDTIDYYTGRRDIQQMSDDQALGSAFLLVASKPYMEWHAFSPELVAHMATIYSGQSLIVYSFKP